MGAAQVNDRGRAARRQLIDQIRVNLAGEIDVGELRLERERALLEPQIQRLVKRKRRLRPLRRMHIDQIRVNLAGEIDVGELRLERERALLEPQIQRLVKRKRRLRPLRRMHMHVHETGKAVTVLPQLDERALRTMRLKRRRLVAIVVFQHARNDTRIVNFDERILKVLERPVHRSMEERAVESLINSASHDRHTFLFAYSTTPRTGSMTLRLITSMKP